MCTLPRYTVFLLIRFQCFACLVIIHIVAKTASFHSAYVWLGRQRSNITLPPPKVDLETELSELKELLEIKDG
jgi:hypothetical protein